MSKPVIRIVKKEEPETTDQKFAQLEEQNLILMDALATTFEEILELRLLVEGGSV